MTRNGGRSYLCQDFTNVKSQGRIDRLRTFVAAGSDRLAAARASGQKQISLTFVVTPKDRLTDCPAR